MCIHRVTAINEEYQRYMEKVRSQAQGAIDKANQQYEHSMGVLTTNIDRYLLLLQQRQVVPGPVRDPAACTPATWHAQEEEPAAGAEQEAEDVPAEASDGPAKEAALAAQQALLERHTNQPANLPLTWLSEEASAQVMTAYENQKAPDVDKGGVPEEPADDAKPDVTMEDAPGALCRREYCCNVVLTGDAGIEAVEAVDPVEPVEPVAPEAAPEPAAATGSLMALLEED